MTQSVAPDSTVSSNTYNGRTTNVINTNAIARSRSVNSQGLLVSVVDALGTPDASSMAYEYDNWGNVSKITDAAGNVTSVYYDLRGRKFKLSDPDIGTWNYVVDSLGQVKEQTDPKNQVTTFTYDVLGRLTKRTEPDLSSNWHYEINAAGVPCANGIGQLCEATSSNGYFRRYAYDSLGRISMQTSHVDTDYVSTWAYDDAGRIGSLTFPASGAQFPTALSIRYNYTSLGLLASISNGNNGARYTTPHWRGLSARTRRCKRHTIHKA